MIADRDYWHLVKNSKLTAQITDIEYIKKSVEIKTAICLRDEKEANLRKKLNFGHTVGHALEAFFLSKNTPLSHGEAVAMGMLAESHLSWQTGLLNANSLTEITHCLQEKFVFPKVYREDYQEITQFLHADKKRRNQQLNFTFLEQIGVSVIHQQATETQIVKALEFL